MKELELKTLTEIRMAGSKGITVVKIMFGADFRTDAKDSELVDIGYESASKVMDAILTKRIAEDPKEQEKAIQERSELLALFPNRIFAKAIPNGYISDWSHKHLPWFVVTTEVGHFTIGWRKRVININWSETVGTKTAEELFEKEDVTKGDKYIHAWSLEKAKEYIYKIISTADLKQLD